MLLHNAQELDNDFGARADENLSLTTLFSIADGFQAVALLNQFSLSGNKL
jgi:hypothetical protein